jgi:hypothetical protein
VAQNTGGTILLKLPSLQKAAERLAALQTALAGTAFCFALQHEGQQSELQGSSGGSAGAGPGSFGSGSGSGSLSSIDASDPWGQRFRLVADAPGFPSPAGIVELQLPCFTGGPPAWKGLFGPPACCLPGSAPCRAGLPHAVKPTALPATPGACCV